LKDVKRVRYDSGVTRFAVLTGALLTAAMAVSPAGAETYRLSASDGTVHFTNAPTDPRYQRMGIAVSGTSAGWLRLPRTDTLQYASEIQDAAVRYGVPERLVQSVIRVESQFNPRAVSVKGARGLM